MDFYEQIIVPQACPAVGATVLVLKAQDGARTTMLLKDILNETVILADMLNGNPLTASHGAPLRIVAPAHYGYKSLKHLSRIEFRPDDALFRPSAMRFMDHPRARVAQEERGRGVPGRLLRYLYRPFVSPTIAKFARAMKQRDRASSSGTPRNWE